MVHGLFGSTFTQFSPFSGKSALKVIHLKVFFNLMTQFSITILLIPFTQAVKQPLQFLVGRYDNNLADYIQTR